MKYVVKCRQFYEKKIEKLLILVEKFRFVKDKML